MILFLEENSSFISNQTCFPIRKLRPSILTFPLQIILDQSSLCVLSFLFYSLHPAPTPNLRAQTLLMLGKYSNHCTISPDISTDFYFDTRTHKFLQLTLDLLYILKRPWTWNLLPQLPTQLGYRPPLTLR